ncbi:MAG TPA: hypothetical protein VJ870_01680 [Amycolatopsis sp.]|nr:hypothetical protein [Amycolatopsis sp.]
MARPRALVAVLAACLLLAGCGSGPSQVGTAVYLGGRTVSIDRVQQLIDKAVQEQPAAQDLARQHKLDQLGREVVRQLIVHQTVSQTAEMDGVGIAPQQIEQVLAQNPFATAVSTANTDPSQLAQQIVYRVRDPREVISDQLLLQSLGAQYFGKMTVTFDYTSVVSDDGGANPVTMREKAFAKAERMAADPGAAAQVIKADAAAGQETGVDEKVPAVQAPDLAGMVLFGVPAGTVVAFQPSAAQPVWIVAIVRGRDLTTQQSVDQTSEPTSTQLAGVGLRLLQTYVDQAGLKVNPRYGVWDPASLTVVANEGETTGLALPVKGIAQP